MRDISVAPMDSSDQSQIIRMMDDVDGVYNRHQNNKRSLLKQLPGSEDTLSRQS